jgi:hypothetical protein
LGRTPGSASGPQKRTGGNADTALRADSTTRRRAAGSVSLSGSCKLHDTLIQVHSGAGAPNEVSSIQILDVLLWMAFRKR